MLYILHKRFVTPEEMFNLNITKLATLRIILIFISQEQFNQDNITSLVRILAKQFSGKLKTRCFSSFFTAISRDSTLSIQETLKMLASPIFNTIIDSKIYTTLFKLIGLDELVNCNMLQFHNGQYFKEFLESLEKSSPEKFSAILPIIKKACAANQEQDLPRRITKFLNSPPDISPPNAGNLLAAHGTFTGRKRANNNSGDAQAKLQKLTPPTAPRKH